MEAEEKELEVITTLQPPSLDTSRRSSVASKRSSSLVPPTPTNLNSETCFLDIPGSGSGADPETLVSPGSRRCSARMMSMNLQHTLRKLRKEEHNARVTSLLKRNAVFYKRQRCCECITMLSVLTVFTCFSLYIVLAHGFHFGKQKPFKMVHNYTRKITKQEGETVEILCQAETHWEWCRWIHMDQYCDFEWVSRGSGVEQIGCDFPKGKVDFIGDYGKHECGLRVHHLDAKDRGIWQCEVEKYYMGFSRRYGEYRQSIINLVVHLKPRTTTTSSPVSTRDPTASALTPNSQARNILKNNTTTADNTTTINPLSEIEEYERQFFLLRVIVLGTIGCVLSSLAMVFWIYFMYLWRTWDHTAKRDSGTEKSPGPGIMRRSRGESFDSEFDGDPYNHDGDDYDDDVFDDDIPDDEHPHFDRELIHSRRKSVSFAVCRVNTDTMQFDIEHKSVKLGNLSATKKSHPPVSPLGEVVKKWRVAKNKLVFKDLRIPNVIMGGTEEFEFKDESFRKRRLELMDKAPTKAASIDDQETFADNIRVASLASLTYEAVEAAPAAAEDSDDQNEEVETAI